MPGSLADELFKLCAKFFEQLPSIDSFQFTHLRKTGRHCERISRERPCLVHRTVGRKLIHNLGASAKRTDRQPATDHFAKRGQIWINAIKLLGTTARHPKTSHDLVENKKSTMQRALLAQRRQKIFIRKI